MLDLESFTYLSRALESDLSPLVILASNRGVVSPRGSSLGNETNIPPSPHGIPPDLLSRLLIIPTFPYERPEIGAIISARSKIESVSLTDEAKDLLVTIGATVSLRYAVGLLGPSAVLSKIAGKVALGTGQMRADQQSSATDPSKSAPTQKSVVRIGADEVKEARDLFWDAGRSAEASAVGSGWLF